MLSLRRIRLSVLFVSSLLRLVAAERAKRLVPVERIELPTFGLQNRCSTAELNRRIEAIGARQNTRPHGSDLRRLEYQTCPQRARTSVRPSQGVPDMKKGDLPAAFRAQFSLLYW